MSYTLIYLQSYELRVCILLFVSCLINRRGEVHNFACAFAFSDVFPALINLSNAQNKTKRQRQVIPENSSQMDGAVPKKFMVDQ